MSVDVRIINRKTNTKKPSSADNALKARTALAGYIKAGKQKQLEPDTEPEPIQEKEEPIEVVKTEQPEQEEESEVEQEPEPEPVKKKKKIKIPEPESESSSDEEIIVQRVSKTKVLKDELNDIKELLKKLNCANEPKVVDVPKKEPIKVIEKPKIVHPGIKYNNPEIISKILLF